jgi:hypothetical protein
MHRDRNVKPYNYIDPGNEEEDNRYVYHLFPGILNYIYVERLPEEKKTGIPPPLFSLSGLDQKNLSSDIEKETMLKKEEINSFDAVVKACSRISDILLMLLYFDAGAKRLKFLGVHSFLASLPAPQLLYYFRLFLKDSSLTENNIQLYICKRRRLESILELNRKTYCYVKAIDNDEIEVEEKSDMNLDLNLSIYIRTWKDLPGIVENGDIIILERLFDKNAQKGLLDENSLDGEQSCFEKPGILLEYQRCCDCYLKIFVEDKIYNKVCCM